MVPHRRQGPAPSCADTDLGRSSSPIGIIVSALGVRAIGMLVDPAVFAKLPAFQRSAFKVTDVVLTGALLGGGADGLHKIVSVFTNFMDVTAKKVKARAPDWNGHHGGESRDVGSPPPTTFG